MKSPFGSRSVLFPSLLIVLVLVAPVALALTVKAPQQQPAVLVTLEGEVTRDGKAVSVDGLQLTPGEVIIWKVRVKNRSARTVSNVRADGLVPKGTQFVPNSFSGVGSRVEYSIDGGASYSAQPTIVVNGKVRPAPMDSYTNVRFLWDGEIAAGESKAAQYKTRLR